MYMRRIIVSCLCSMFCSAITFMFAMYVIFWSNDMKHILVGSICTIIFGICNAMVLRWFYRSLCEYNTKRKYYVDNNFYCLEDIRVVD